MMRKCDRDATYRMGSILQSIEMDHAIDTCKGGTVTLAAMRIELFLCEDITTCLPGLLLAFKRKTKQIRLTSQEKETIVNDYKGKRLEMVSKRGVIP
jgi:hypothetical protein